MNLSQCEIKGREDGKAKIRMEQGWKAIADQYPDINKPQFLSAYERGWNYANGIKQDFLDAFYIDIDSINRRSRISEWEKYNSYHEPKKTFWGKVSSFFIK